MPPGKNVFSTISNFTTNHFLGQRRDTCAPRFLFHFQNSNQVMPLHRTLFDIHPDSMGMSANHIAAFGNANARPAFAEVFVVIKTTKTESDVLKFPLFYIF